MDNTRHYGCLIEGSSPSQGTKILMVSVVVAHECKNRLQEMETDSNLFAISYGERGAVRIRNHQQHGLVAELVVCTCLLSSDDTGSSPVGATD